MGASSTPNVCAVGLNSENSGPLATNHSGYWQLSSFVTWLLASYDGDNITAPDAGLMARDIVLTPLASAPTAKEGQEYVNSTDHTRRVYLNSAWQTVVTRAVIDLGSSPAAAVDATLGDMVIATDSSALITLGTITGGSEGRRLLYRIRNTLGSDSVALINSGMTMTAGGSGVTLKAGKYNYFELVYNAGSSKWDMIREPNTTGF